MIAHAGRLWAIARMTLLEASRRKVFWILLLFTVALLSSVLFFPAVNEEGRLRLIQIWSLRAAALFTAIVGLFLAGFSLPQDFEQKRIYLLVSKPVPKPLVFLGRFLGYAMLLAVFVAAMGLVTVFFLRIVKLSSGPKFPPLAAHLREEARTFTHRGANEITGGGATLAIGAEPGRALVWQFRGLKRSRFPEPEISAQVRLIFGAKGDPFRNAGTALVTVRTPSGASREFRLPMNTNEERAVSFPAAMVGEDGALDVEVACGDADGLIAAAQGWVILFEKSMLFEAAFARGLGLILMQSLVVLSVTLMASTFLSAPLSILLGILLYVIGSIHGYVRDGTRDIDKSLADIKMAEPGARVRTPENLPKGLLEFSTRVSKAVLAVVPDFAHFDYSTWLLKDRAVSWGELFSAAVWAMIPVAALVALGTGVMMFKDFG